MRVPAITSAFVAHNTTRNDAITGLPLAHLAGRGWITERCGPLALRIRPHAFYQTNPEQAERLYATALDAAFADLSAPLRLVFDLYCGIGSISLLVASRLGGGGAPSADSRGGAGEAPASASGLVVGVETVPAAIEAARENAELNGIRNAAFVEAPVEDGLEGVVERWGAPDLVIVDPPRAGLHPRARAAINALGAPRIVYVSCNPRSQALDIGALDRYRPTWSRAVDMFPQTRHVENIVVLDRVDIADGEF